jgi:formylglycine-generating enzyme required for sulfatase activity
MPFGNGAMIKAPFPCNEGKGAADFMTRVLASLVASKRLKLQYGSVKRRRLSSEAYRNHSAAHAARNPLQKPLAWPRYGPPLCSGPTRPTLALLLVTLLLLVGLAGCLPRAASPGKEMVFVPAGAFWMGNEEGAADEGPIHQVYLEAFWIDRYEVTNAQYAEFLNATQGDPGRCGGHICADAKVENPDSHLLYEEGRYVAERGYEDHPVTEVSWYGAKAYCQHYAKRLPSEAEWEKTARGTDGTTYPWGEEFDPHKLNSDDRVGDTTPVGSYPDGASPYGVFDMAGNVWEWVADWYDAYPGSAYRSPFFGHKYKVVRGGSWNHPGDDARCARRDIAHPDRRLRVVGFRCARDN